jgi:hypothetical protein
MSFKLPTSLFFPAHQVKRKESKREGQKGKRGGGRAGEPRQLKRKNKGQRYGQSKK